MMKIQQFKIKRDKCNIFIPAIHKTNDQMDEDEIEEESLMMKMMKMNKMIKQKKK